MLRVRRRRLSHGFNTRDRLTGSVSGSLAALLDLRRTTEGAEHAGGLNRWSQPEDVHFIKWVSATSLSTWSQLTPWNVRNSKPMREGLIHVRTIGPRHLGQVWDWIAMRLVSNKTASDGMMLTSIQAGAQRSRSPTDTFDGRWWGLPCYFCLSGAVPFCSLLKS